jgi:hypothetical protein
MPSSMEFVYIMNGGQLHKIGRTADLRKRCLEINRGSPVPVSVVCSWETTQGEALESHLHRRFEAVYSHGEWFKLSVEQVNDLLQIKEWPDVSVVCLMTLEQIRQLALS